jgi:transcription initiation factor TFIIIB Brf1 subunit/transcription initiation factor TFIIB
VHYRFDLLQETMFLTTLLIDRYLSVQTVEKKQLQLVGVTAMLIASKYEEMWPPEVNDFVYMTDNAYTKAEIIKMEMTMLRDLEYNLGNPLPTQFVQRYTTATGANTDTTQVAGYIMELSITSYEMVAYKQSTLAASALVLAGQITGQSCWGEALQHYSGYSLDQLKPCMQALQLQLKQSVSDGATLKAIRKKHSKTKFHATSAREDVNKYIASL